MTAQPHTEVVGGSELKALRGIFFREGLLPPSLPTGAYGIKKEDV